MTGEIKVLGQTDEFQPEMNEASLCVASILLESFVGRDSGESDPQWRAMVDALLHGAKNSSPQID